LLQCGIRQQSIKRTSTDAVCLPFSDVWKSDGLKGSRLDPPSDGGIIDTELASDLADEITREVRALTIGIGASPQCDGQILVTDDMLGLFDWTPKFVRRYGKLREVIGDAVAAYAKDVRSGQFPGEAELYRLRAR